MVTVIADGTNGHRIEGANGALLGLIRGKTIRLTGFSGDADALRATTPLWRALDAMLGRAYPGWPRYEPGTAPLRLVHDGAHEWTSDGTRTLARVLRPAPGATDRTLSLEFLLPSYATDGVLITAASALVHALERWRDAEPPTARAEATLEAAGAAPR